MAIQAKSEVARDPAVIHIPMKFRHRGGRREMIVPQEAHPEEEASSLLLAVAEAFRWQKMIDNGEAASAAELADRLGKKQIPFARQLRFTLLAPQIIMAILDGKEPKEISINRLRDGNIPMLWQEQMEYFGFMPNGV
jgi:hypothetical protein